MRYLSVCSGVEAATQAWHPLGWRCVGVSEIEPFPRAVLEQRLGAVPAEFETHRYSAGDTTIPLFGDFTKIEEHHVGPVDLLVGGTPCQSFSVAGKRLGLDDPRGNLTLEFLALARRVRAKWIVWENVPGVLSHDEGRTMGTFLRLVGECGYRWAYRVLDAQYVRVGRFGRAVPQRRRRVFLVGYSGTGDFDPRAVLFDRESLRGNPAPRREAGEGAAPTLKAGSRGGGGLGPDFQEGGGLRSELRAAPTLDTAIDKKFGSNQWVDSGQFVLEDKNEVAHTLRAEGFDASEDGTGRGTPIVPCFAATDYKDGTYSEVEVSGPLTTTEDQSRNAPVTIAFSAKDCGSDATEEVSPTLKAGGHAKSHANGGVMPAVAFDMRGREGGIQPEGPHETANIRAASGGSSRSYVAADWRVRRLTPVECERLQGFPDDFTRIEWRGKPADKCPDGHRYKAMGNSMAVNVMAWIGERLHAVSTYQGDSNAKET